MALSQMPINPGALAKAGDHFPDPFADMASLAMPKSIEDALQWCQYLLMANGPYREAISRVISYFITDVEIVTVGKDRVGREEKEKYLNFLNDTLGIKKVLHAVALDYLCFHGDTRVPTREGVFKIRELEGRTVDVISRGGVYRPATFKRFGRQALMEVKFSDDRVVLATPEHEWVVLNCSGKEVRVSTTALRPGYRIERTVAPRPEKNEDYYEGVRHGFTFGDGSLYNKNCPNRQTKAVANFFGEKGKHLFPFFEGHGSAPREQQADRERYSAPRYKIHGLPAHYKSLPLPTASASYWYGFVMGFLAADGSVDTYGCAVLTQKTRATLEAIEAQLPRLGMVAGPIRQQTQETLLPEYKGKRQEHVLTMHYMTLLKQFMCADDFIIPAHRENFERNWSGTNYGRFIGIKSVEPTAIEDDVYCCVEMETHTFVVDNGILTGNCYGNSFTSIIVPFRRYLSCPKCGLEAPLKKVYNSPEFAFKWSQYQFIAHCPHCGYRGPWRHIDRRSGERGGVRVKRWNPHEIQILWDPHTDDTAYIWKIPEEYRTMIARGHLFHLERASWEIVQAVKNNHSLLFDKDVIYHMREEAMAGVKSRGWGVSRVLTNFRQAWYYQVLHRYNEAIALDYVIPFRVITPMPHPGQGGEAADPVLTMNLGGFVSRVNQMVRERRRDPTRWNVLPFPIEYQALGGDATQLAPKDLLELGLDTLLTSVGIPVELYKGTLSMQAAPAALRLFEAHWSHLVHALNRFLDQLTQKISQVMSWEPVCARLQRVTHADDLNRQMAKLQMMMGGQISKTTGLATVGLDHIEELRKQLEEQRLEAEAAQEQQEEMEAAAQMDQMAMPQPPMPPVAAPQGMPQFQGMPGAMPGGGMPATGGANSSAGMPAPAGPMGIPMGPMGGMQAFMAQIGTMPTDSPEQLQTKAQTIADQVEAMPETQKDSFLINLKREDPTLHALVKSILEDNRRRREIDGRAMIEQQMGKQSRAILL